MMSEEKRTPKLRFSGFENKYIYYKLNQLVKKISSGKTNIKEKQDKNGKYPIFGSRNIIGYSNSFDYDGDYILIARVGANAGTLYKVQGKCGVTDNTLMLETNDLINKNYLYYYLKQYNLNRLIFGSGQPLITGKQLKKINMNIPEIKEQNKIANFLLKIDEKIELLEQKHEKYQNFKKYLMQQIFTQKLRFDFDIVKLNDISKINKGKQLNKDDMLDDGEFYVLNGGQEPSGYTNTWNTPENTITISEGGNSCGFVNFNEEKFWSGGHCYYLSDLSTKIDNYYLFSYLKFIEPKIMRLRVGSGLPNIQKGDIENIKVKITNINEQNKISSILKSTELYISSIYVQKQNFEIFKKGLLQQMFV